MRMRTLLILSLLASPAAAQDSTETVWTREVVNSAKLKEQRNVYVVTPAAYRTDTRRYPVLIILDADDRAQFNLAVATVEFYASRLAIPQMIVVGIPNGKDRTHDLAPPGSASDLKEYPTAGGAPAFIDFIVDEVVPLVRSKYRTLPGIVLAGWSIGGVAALEVAAKKPGAFHGVIAMSPSLWWNDSAGVVAYSDAIAKSTKVQRIFVTSGGREDWIDETTDHFAARMDSLKPAHAAVGHIRYQNDTHGLTPARSLADGLRFVFQPVSTAYLPISEVHPWTDLPTVVKAFEESRRTYASGARFFGLDERLPENEVNSLGYLLLGGKRNNPPAAVWVFKQNVDLYPGSANGYDSLADGYLAAGDTTAATAQYRLGVEVATRTRDPMLEGIKKRLKALEERQAKTKKE